MTAAELELIACHAGRHLAECNTDLERQSVKGLLRKIVTQLDLRDRHFSVQKFNKRVAEAEKNFRTMEKVTRHPSGPDVFTVRAEVSCGPKQLRRKATPTRRKDSKQE